MEQYLKLVKQTLQNNEFGQPIPTETIRTVIADSKSVTRTEFYQAIEKFRPEVVFVIRGYEYEGETVVEDEQGKRYNVIRTYQTEFEDMELTCQSLN